MGKRGQRGRVVLTLAHLSTVGLSTDVDSPTPLEAAGAAVDSQEQHAPHEAAGAAVESQEEPTPQEADDDNEPLSKLMGRAVEAAGAAGGAQKETQGKPVIIQAIAILKRKPIMAP